MAEKRNLYILWTNADPITAENMVFMYAVNSRIHDWWENVTVIIWGAPAKLVAHDVSIQHMIEEAKSAGVHVSACRACADQLGVREKLEALDIDIKHWGGALTELMKNGEQLITI